MDTNVMLGTATHVSANKVAGGNSKSCAPMIGVRMEKLNAIRDTVTNFQSSFSL